MVRAVLGGSFDPVHLGHVAMAAAVLERGLARKLLVIPAGRSPHKDDCLAPADDRLAMCRAAFSHLPDVEIDDRELRRPGPSFTVDTLRELLSENPADELVLVIGADNLDGFPDWREPDVILGLANLAVFARDGVIPDSRSLDRAGIPSDRAVLVPDFDHRVSSTEVRGMLDRGLLPESLLPGEVAAHIRSRHLYGM